MVGGGATEPVFTLEGSNDDPMVGFCTWTPAVTAPSFIALNRN
jgi:hypothetical protein